MSQPLATPEAPVRSRGRWQLLALLAVVIGPILLATAMYEWRFWVPEGRNYHGELYGDGRSAADLGVGGTLPKKWLLLVTAPQDCDNDCRQLVYLARQVQIGLNRDIARASQVLAHSRTLDGEYELLLKREYPQLDPLALDASQYQALAGDDQVGLWIVDPLGNLVLRYGSDAEGRKVLDDLRLLLKLSQIG
jgi:hypothetical protein